MMIGAADYFWIRALTFQFRIKWALRLEVMLLVQLVLLPLGLPFQAFGESSQELADLRRRAEMGFGWAQAKLGLKYFNGTGVDKDYAEAVRWLRLADASGDSLGWQGLGHAYRMGVGSLERDYCTALKYYRKAAEAGRTQSMCWMGVMHANGLGTPVDEAEAIKWYSKAVERGDTRAMALLGTCWVYGKGIPKDCSKGINLLERAIAGDGDCQALYIMGWIYCKGRCGIDQNYGTARALYEAAAAKDHEMAMRRLGEMYRDGLGVPKDLQKAGEWFYKAALKGDEDAKKELERAGIRLPKPVGR